jgi:multidrug resistance efflux pump
MKKRVILAVLFALSLLLSGCKAEEDNAQADIITLGNETKEQIVEAYGVIKSSEVKDIMIGFPATLEQIDVKNGQRVGKDELLMVLNLEEYQAQIKEMECDLNLLKKEADISKDQSDLSEEQMEVFQAQEDKLMVQEENLSLWKEKLETDNIKQNKVVADLENGLVYNIVNENGTMVYAGSRLMSIADLDSIMINANIDQQFIGWVEIGAVADIIPEYDKTVVYKGKVSFKSSKAFLNNGETVVPVEITLDDAKEGLIIDSDVQVKIYPLP